VTTVAASSPAIRRPNRRLLVPLIVIAIVIAYYFVLRAALAIADPARADSAGAVALQQTVNALSIGSIYALIALGYTMVYGIIELINFAHGDVFMVGAFTSLVFLKILMGQSGPIADVPLLILLIVGALAFTMPLTALLNVSIERIFYRPLRHASRLAPLITAIGVSFILQNLALVIAGSGDRGSPQIFSLQWRVELLGASVPVLSFVTLAIALSLMAVLQLFVGRTRLGRAMRSTAQDQQASRLMGVDVNQTIALTFLLGGALAGAAGVVWGLNFGYVRQDLGFNAGLKAFTSAVLGGIGNITGAVIGGFFIGFVENFSSSLGLARWAELLVFVVLTMVLVFRPTGILGQQLGDRA
jgi:branched-chain amino acid transport system permease protein